MPPKRIERVSIFNNMSLEQMSQYLGELKSQVTADGLLMFPTDIEALKNAIDASLDKKKKGIV